MTKGKRMQRAERRFIAVTLDVGQVSLASPTGVAQIYLSDIMCGVIEERHFERG